ncbi:MAG: GSCFA domain-containing protein [Stenotrophobium sp.]
MVNIFNGAFRKLKAAKEPPQPQDSGFEDRIAKQIQAAYCCLLGREAEPEGRAHWTAFLSEGGSYDELLLNFVRSAEFQRRLDASVQPSDPTTDISLVQAAYRCLLGREAEPEGQAHWMTFLREDGSYDKLLKSFVHSSEFRRRLDESAHLTAGAAIEQRPVTAAPAPRSNLAVIGNNQAAQMAHCIQALTGGEMPAWRCTTEDILLGTESTRADLLELFRKHDKVFVQTRLWNAIAKLHQEFKDRVVLFPSISFLAFHPDLVSVSLKSTGASVRGPCGDYHSSLAFLGWKAGLSVAETQKLYRNEIFQRLGFFHFWQSSTAALLEEGKTAGLALSGLLDDWLVRGCFMHSIHSPKLFVIADIAKALLQRNGVAVISGNPAEYAYDSLANGAIWPVYPEIGEKLVIAGNYTFKLAAPNLLTDEPVRTLDLKEFLTRYFAVYSSHSADDLTCDRLNFAGYPELLADLRSLAANPATAEPASASAQTPPSPDGSAPKNRSKFAVLGNCQTGHMARCLQALAGGKMPQQEWVTAELLADWENGRASLAPLFARHEKIFMQPWIWTPLAQKYAEFKDQVVLYPSIGFIAYHPDLVPVVIKSTGAAFEDGPAMRCNSSLAFLGWKAGLSVAETTCLFRRDIYQRLGFFDYWQSSTAALLEEGRAAELPLDDLLAEWSKQGCFMHCHVHPKLSVIADIAAQLLKRLGIPVVYGDPIQFAHDYLANGIVWPVYPEIGEALGCPGSYAFKMGSLYYSPDTPVHMLGLKEFIDKSFAAYSKYSRDELISPRLGLDSYRELLGQLQNHKEPLVSDDRVPLTNTSAAPARTPSIAGNGHPYHDLPPQRFWRRAIENVRPEQVDPVLKTKFKITPANRVATAGSCFAQRISERLSSHGFNFLQTENPLAGITQPEAARRNFGAFSARFGFVYTARQLRQLMERAYGNFIPADSVWQLGDGRFVDPFRPRIEPDGFRSQEELESSRLQHLAAVRRMFETLDVFIFTLGLTEAWRNKTDGAVFPIAPGVAGGVMNFKRYEFVNFTASEVDDDLQQFMTSLAKINSAARVILTVSPVPLVATYDDKHVLASTTYSKSVLRVAAEQIAQRHSNCDYFPSYEIITGNFNRGRYFAEDLRSITQAGVDHVMRLFFGHYAPGAESGAINADLLAEARKSISYLCDEELLAIAAR